MPGFREEVLRHEDRDMIKYLLKIITGRDNACEQQLTGFLRGLVGKITAGGYGSHVVPCLTLQAILAWSETAPESKDILIRQGLVAAAFVALKASLPRACCDEVAMHTVSAAAKVILFCVRDTNIDMTMEFLEQCDGVDVLLDVCRADGSCPRSICIGLHLLKHITKHSPRLLHRAMELDGPEIICILLRDNKDADIIKFAALTLSRWAATPSTQGRLVSSGAYEQLWEILRTKEKYESSVYAYVMLAICLMMTGRIEEVSHAFVENPQDLVRFCKAVEHHEASFHDQGVVRHTLEALVSSSKSFDVIIEAAKNDVLCVLGQCNVRCGHILDNLYKNRDHVHDIHDIQLRLQLAVFLVQKMPSYPNLSLDVLFHGKDALIGTLVAHSFEHLMVVNTQSGEESADSDTDDECMHLTKFSWENQSIVLDSPGGFQMDKSCTKYEDCQMDKAPVEEEEHLGNACFRAFASKNSVLGSLVVLCKIALKMRTKESAKRKSLPLCDRAESKRMRTPSHAAVTESSRGDVCRFVVAGETFEIEHNCICAMSHVAASMCQDSGSDEDEIHVPCLDHLSGAEMIQSFRRVVEWCKTGALSNLNSMEEMHHCWIMADYLAMPSLETYIGKQVVTHAGASWCNRADVFAKLHALHSTFYGSYSLESTIAECIVTELGACEPGLDTISNLDFLNEFVRHPTIADRVVQVFQQTLM